jgi:tetratricopeptide (TPR) repeat protein
MAKNRKKMFLLLAGILFSHLGISAGNRMNLIASGDSCVSHYDYFHALQYYRQAQKKFDDFQIQMKIADCYYCRSDFQSCTDLLKKIDEDSLSHDAFREIFYSYGSMKQSGSQVYWGNQLLSRYPMDSKILADLMHVYSTDEVLQPQNAIEVGLKYCKTDSENIDVNCALAEAYFANRNFNSSLDEYQRLLLERDTTYSGLYHLGLCCQYLDQMDSARVYLQTAVSRYPTYPVAYYLLGVVENRLGDFPESCISLEKAAKLYMPDPTLMHIIYKCLGQSYAGQQKNSLAIDSWTTALKYQDDPDLRSKMEELQQSNK